MNLEPCGEIGKALAGLAEDNGGVPALAKLLGMPQRTLENWIENAAKPSKKSAERLCEHFPALRDLLTAYDCFRSSYRSKSAPRFNARARKPQTPAQRAARMAAQREAAEAHMDYESRIDLIRRRHRVMLRKRSARANYDFTPSYEMDGL